MIHHSLTITHVDNQNIYVHSSNRKKNDTLCRNCNKSCKSLNLFNFSENTCLSIPKKWLSQNNFEAHDQISLCLSEQKLLILISYTLCLPLLMAIMGLLLLKHTNISLFSNDITVIILMIIIGFIGWKITKRHINKLLYKSINPDLNTYEHTQ